MYNRFIKVANSLVICLKSIFDSFQSPNMVTVISSIVSYIGYQTYVLWIYKHKKLKIFNFWSDKHRI